MTSARPVARVLKWATPVVVVVQAVLVATGVLDLGSGVRIALGIEAVLLAATLGLAVAAVSMVEIGVVHWLLPWAWARIVLGLLGLYGAVWLWGFYQTFRRRPHYVHDGRLVLRCGLLGEIVLAVEDFADAREDFRSWGTRSFAVHEDADGGTAISLTPSGMTDVTVEVTGNAVVHARCRTLIGPRVHLGCDHPDELVDYLRASGAVPDRDTA